MGQQFAFVFPGQGSQTVGMLSALNDVHSVVKSTFDEASEYCGKNLWSLVQDGPISELSKTEITQPVMFVAGIAVWRAWKQVSDLQPNYLAGHSLGEYTAYVCAESLSLEQGLQLVIRRGELMRDACPDGQGKMAALLGLDDEQVMAACSQAAEGQVVQAVNFNAPGQVVIAGHAAAVDRAVILAREAGARKAMPLPVSVPCHSDLMRSASEELARQLMDAVIVAPKIPVFNNVDGNTESDPEQIRAKLERQLYSPVLWVKTVQAMVAKNVSVLVECGPGKILCGMNKRIERSLQVLSLQDPDGFDKALETLQPYAEADDVIKGRD